ncbi:MAG TPA: hypothetical protein VJH92_05685 [Candidatus Nanoarchaeia archaeon]|nr:hypothetical protein [Candidatus Nanoarchaeia archaeon]
MKKKYTLKVHAHSPDLGSEYIGYSYSLFKGKEKLTENTEADITRLGSRLISVLMDHADSKVDIKTSGVFYNAGNMLIEDIVSLHNARF